jgi:hypothetical protein
MRAVRSADASVTYRALRQRTEALVSTNKSFVKHVKSLYSYRRSQELLHSKHFQQATEVGGQVLDEFIQHRVTLEHSGERRGKYFVKQTMLKSREKTAQESVDSHIAGMRRQDRRKVAAVWNCRMERAYQEFVGNAGFPPSGTKRSVGDDSSDQSRMHQSMANFLRFGKIAIKLPTTQANKYRHRLVGVAGGDRRIVRELINQPARKIVVAPVFATKEKSSLWKKIASKVRKIGNARKLTDSRYGHHHETGMTEGEASVAEIRLSEAILNAHNWGVEGYIQERAKYLKNRSRRRSQKNEERRIYVKKKHDLLKRRIELVGAINATKDALLQHQHKPSLESNVAKLRLVPDKSVKRFLLGREKHREYNSAKEGSKTLQFINSDRDKSEAVVDSKSGGFPRTTKIKSTSAHDATASPLNLTRVIHQTTKYTNRVRSKGGGGFHGDDLKRVVTKEKILASAIAIQRIVRGYIARLYAWAKRWLLEPANQSAIFNVYSGDSSVIDLRPFAMLAGMFGKSLPNQRTVAYHKFVIRYQLHLNRGLALKSFQLWISDENITHAYSDFEKIRVAQVAKAQYRVIDSSKAM